MRYCALKSFERLLKFELNKLVLLLKRSLLVAVVEYKVPLSKIRSLNNLNEALASLSERILRSRLLIVLDWEIKVFNLLKANSLTASPAVFNVCCPSAPALPPGVNLLVAIMLSACCVRLL